MKENKYKIIMVAVIFFAAMLMLKLNAQVHYIQQNGNTFSPANLTVNIGDTIIWQWTSGSHTTTSVNIPAGAATWDSPLTQGNASFQYIPGEPGVYDYHCTPHAAMGMTGSFEVLLATNNRRGLERPQLRIYPNPARDFVTIEMSKEIAQCELRINDLIGNIVRTQFCNEATAVTIFLDDLIDGIYTVSISDNSTKLFEKKLLIIK